MKTLPSLDVFPTFISDEGNSSNVSASAVAVDNCGKGKHVPYLPLLVTPLANDTRLRDGREIGNLSPILSASLI